MNTPGSMRMGVVDESLAVAHATIAEGLLDVHQLGEMPGLS